MSLTDDLSTNAAEMPRDEGRRLLDEAARRKLGLSGEEFLAALPGSWT